MRISKLLVSGVLLLVAGSTQAAVVGGVRQKPVPEKAAFQYGETYYLYNVGSQKYFLGDNDWTTRASVGETGWKVRFSKFVAEEGAEWDGKTVLFEDSVLNGNSKNKWLKVWFTTSKDATSGSNYLDGGLYTDYNNQADYYWTILPQADNIYRFAASESNPSYLADSISGLAKGQVYVGFDKNREGDTRVYAFLNDDNAVDWYFVSADAYKANQALLGLYHLAQQLKAQIDLAKSKGIDVAAWTAIYENESSTEEQLKAAIEEAKTAISKAEESSVDVNHPIDKTSLLTNPGYDDGNNGWAGDAPGFGYGAAEHYNKTYNSYQKITGAANGVYALSLQAFYRAGWCANSYDNFNKKINDLAKLYAVAGNDTVMTSIMNAFADARDSRIGTGSEHNEKGSDKDPGVAFIPNNMQAAAAYFEEGRYKNNIVFFGVDNNDFQVGLMKTSKLDGDWTLFDNWALTYYGNSAEAFKKWQNQVLLNAYDATTIPDGTLVTKGAVDAYNAVKNGLQDPTSKADVIANIKKVNEAAEVLKANMAAWAAYQEAVNAADATVNDNDIAEGELKALLGDLVWGAEDDIMALTLTTEEVLAKVDELKAANENCIKNSIKVGADVTDKFLVNARYENGATGWNGSPTVNGPANNKCAEKFNTAFDVYQVVKNAPVGVYSVSLQGFYRPGDNSVAWPIYFEEMKWTKPTSICVYVNNNTSELKNIYDEQVKKPELFQTTGLVGPAPFEAEVAEGDTLWFVNDMTNSGIAFAQGLYTSTAFGLVAKKGDELRIGIKGEKDNASQWVCWDNFKMVYQGFSAEIISPELSKAIASAETYINGDAPAQPMSKTSFENLKKGIADGKTALSGTDGKAMFDALSELFEAIDKAKTSVVTFTKLLAEAEELLNMSQSTSCPASTETKAQAAALAAEVKGAIEECTMEDSEVEEYQTKIAEMMVKLQIPEGEASDTNPLKFTNVIKTPSFEDENGKNSIEGWNFVETKGSFGNNDEQKGALLYEFYEKEKVDMYQDIIGLPNGTYMLSADAFCRMGSSENDIASYEANPDTTSNAFIYATSEGVTSGVGIKCISSGHMTDKIGVGAENEVTINGTTAYLPNDMISASGYFSLDLYKHTAVVKVTDGKLRIGLRKDTKVQYDWLIVDNFELYYYGENSSKEPSGDPVGIENISDSSKAQLVEFYNVNGTRMTSLTKGLNIIKMTAADGKVTVKKVVVK